MYEDNYLFLGSRLGNSLLLRFYEKDNYQVITIDDNEPSAKRCRVDSSDAESTSQPEKPLETLNDCIAGDVAAIKDVDELEVYGNERQTSMQITSYIFEV